MLLKKIKDKSIQMVRDEKLLLIVLAVFIAIIFWRFSTLLYFPSVDNSLEKGNLIKLQPKETLRQTFSSGRNNLAKIEIILRSPGIKAGDAAETKLLDENCQNLISMGDLQSSFLSSNNLYEFSFPIVPDSQNKNYCLEITFLPQQDTAKALQFFAQDNSGASFENITTGANYENQSLSLRLDYRSQNISENFTELNQRISQYKPWFLKHYYLDLIAFGFIILSVILILIFVLTL